MFMRPWMRQRARMARIAPRLPLSWVGWHLTSGGGWQPAFCYMNTPNNQKPPVNAGSIAAALAAAGVEISPARRTLGGECQSVGELLRSGERPAGPLLQAVQAGLDRELCEWSAYHLNAKMVGDGRESLWQRERGQAAGWCATMADAIGDGVQALALWRAGLCLVRDSGADVITLGEPGGVCAAWVKAVAPVAVPASESTAQAVAGYWAGQAGAVKVACKLASMAARVAWRAVGDSVARDMFGETPAQARMARDWMIWATAARDLPELSAEQRAQRRLVAVEAMRAKLASGRGRRAAFADKVKQAVLLMLNGASADDAAAAAGFKPCPRRGRSGAISSSHRMAAALRRAGVRVMSKRAVWAQAQDEFEAASQRGGAKVDLVKLWGGLPRYEAPAVQPALRAGTHCGASCLAAARVRNGKRLPGCNRRVIGLHPLSRGTSGDAGGVAVVTPSPVPLLPGQVRRIVRASRRRKLRGVIRSV